jgi:hypothetical protein
MGQFLGPETVIMGERYFMLRFPKSEEKKSMEDEEMNEYPRKI